MLSKATSLARALALILAIVSGFVAIPSLDTGLTLVVLGLIAGIAYSEDAASRLVLTALVLPAVSTALNLIPQVGTQLGQIATNMALVTAGAVATLLAVRAYGLLKADVAGLGGN